MRTTRYFVEQVLRKRTYLSLGLCVQAVANPVGEVIQEDGRVRLWGRVIDPRDGSMRILRVVLLPDRDTLHNAFFDRGFREGAP